MDLDQGEWTKKYKLLKDSKIIDVRTPQEFEEFRIPDSENVDFYDPQNFVKKLVSLIKKDLIFYIVNQGLEVIILA